MSLKSSVVSSPLEHSRQFEFEGKSENHEPVDDVPSLNKEVYPPSPVIVFVCNARELQDFARAWVVAMKVSDRYYVTREGFWRINVQAVRYFPFNRKWNHISSIVILRERFDELYVKVEVNDKIDDNGERYHS